MSSSQMDIQRSESVQKTVKKSWKIELEKEMKALLLEQNEEQQEEKSDYYNVLHAPYIAGFSKQLARELKIIHIGLTFQKGRTIYNSVCKLKPIKHPDDRKRLFTVLDCF